MTHNPTITPDKIYSFLGLDCTVNRYADRAQWKASRHGELFDRVGASELAALFGCEGAYDSQYSLYAKRVDPDVWAEAVEAESMEWGHLVEDLILRQYGKQTGHACHAWPQTDICVSKTFPAFCTPDSLVVDGDGPIVCELKGYSEYDRARWKDGPPLNIVIQSLMQQEVTGIHRGRVVVLFGNQIRRLGVFNVDYDESFAAAIRQRADRFAYYVRNREEPPVDESSMTAEAIYRLHPDDDGSEADLPEESDAWAAAFEQAKADAKDAQERVDLYGNLLKSSIGDATYGVTPGNRWFSWKTQERAAFQVAAGKSRVLRAMAKPPKI